MQDGRIEQIGTPLELYDHPANLFVAQFIGSPAMNVVTGTLRRDADDAWIDADGGGRWPLATNAPGSDGMRVAYGVRPSDLGVAAGARSIAAEVIVVEPTGAETELLVRVGTNEIVVVVHGRPNAEPGATVPLAIDSGAVHLFDPTSGEALS
jgi:multiple sugar transport system ATP-binding protein